mgnify:CR=1 FL=1
MATARLGNYAFGIDPSTAKWGYELKTNKIQTKGGTVVQIIARNIGDLTITGYLSARGLTNENRYQRMEEFQQKMADIMQNLRVNPPKDFAGDKVVKVVDYKKPEETGLPAANVLIYTLENGATVVVRPSGTEPKIKTYFTTLGKDLAEAQAQKDALAAAIEPILK